MPSSDVHLARGKAKETLMEQLAHVKLPTNSNKQYDHNKMIKVLKIVTRVLTETFNNESNGKGMSELLESTTNAVNSVKTTQSVSYMTELKGSKDNAAKATKAAKAAAPNTSIVAPLILDMEAARAEAERQNIYNQTIVGTKGELSKPYEEWLKNTSSTR